LNKNENVKWHVRKKDPQTHSNVFG